MGNRATVSTVETKSINEYVLEFVRIIEYENSYFGKFIDLFMELPDRHQAGLFKFFVEEIGADVFEIAAKDSEIEFVKCLLMYYSNKIDSTKPSRRTLIEMLNQYRKSDIALKIEEGFKTEDFKTALRGLK